ncbi:MAG TPA: NrfD/PsrC family molybdoenzyme membrane anchor subunit [Solirubrobacteraceae bacterium]|jgi:hypothetical protein|nr:NrfD/PsrC family molybdoenzyme membrane anchor subunit [Solirubrobacteraceae bacterium]
MVPPAEPRSYYGQSVINPPIWKSEIPWYFFTGGLAGASLPLSLAASLQGNEALARRAAFGALGGAVVSPALLVSDLGRPERFLYMLRVFKVTSPMSVGSWILTGFGATSALGAARELLGRMPRAGRAAQVAGSLLGAGMATYTAALVANTAVPAWHEARRELPFVFAASAVASAGGFAAALTPVRHAGPARAMAIAGGVTEVALTGRMERRLGFVGEPYRAGTPQRLATAAKALTAAGSVLMARAGGRRSGAAAAGLALMAGAAAERWAIFQAGMASAKDPRYTVGPQRDRLEQRA